MIHQLTYILPDTPVGHRVSFSGESERRDFKGIGSIGVVEEYFHSASLGQSHLNDAVVKAHPETAHGEHVEK